MWFYILLGAALVGAIWWLSKDDFRGRQQRDELHEQQVRSNNLNNML